MIISQRSNTLFTMTLNEIETHFQQLPGCYWYRVYLSNDLNTRFPAVSSACGELQLRARCWEKVGCSQCLEEEIITNPRHSKPLSVEASSLARNPTEPTPAATSRTFHRHWEQSSSSRVLAAKLPDKADAKWAPAGLCSSVQIHTCSWFHPIYTSVRWDKERERDMFQFW